MFDHTSVLKYLTQKWGLDPLPSRRIDAATSIGIALTRTSLRIDTITRIVMSADQLRVPDLEIEDLGSNKDSQHHEALRQLTKYLPTALWEETRVQVVEGLPRFYAAF